MEVNRFCSLMSGFRSTVHTKSFFLLLLFSLICFDSCTDVRTHQTLFLFLLNMASFFSETTNLLHCFTPHTFPRISQPSNAYNSLFVSAYLCHFCLVFLAHSLGCHSEICQETNESCGDTKSWIYCIVLQKKVPTPRPICPLLRLFSLFYDCAPVTVSPCSHGNLLSRLSATHIVRAVRLLPDTFALSLQHKSVFECLCAVSMSEELFILSDLEIHIVCLFPLTRTQTHQLTCTVRSALLLRVIWSLAWDLGWIRQAAAAWYSCHPQSTTGVHDTASSSTNLSTRL